MIAQMKDDKEKKSGRDKEVKPEVLTWLDPARLSFQWDGKQGPVRMTVQGDKSCPRVFAAYAFPQSDLGHYIELYDGKPDGSCGEIVGMIESLGELSADAREAVAECLKRNHLTPQIQRIVSIEDRYHLIRWTVETNRGSKTFEMEDVDKNISPCTNRRFVLVDVNGNHYEISNIDHLDPQSAKMLGEYL